MASPRPWPFPLEVTTTIISYAYHKDLVALSLVCRALQLVSQPRLFADIRLTQEKHFGRYPSPLDKLLSIVIEQAGLAYHVQSLRLSRAPPAGSNNDVLLLTDGGLALGERPHYVVRPPEVHRSDVDVVMARLVSSLPRLQYLELSIHCEQSSTASGEVLKREIMNKDRPPDRRSSTPSLTSLVSLKHASYFTAVNIFPFHPYYTHQQQPRFQDFLWFFYLPSLESLHATAVETSLPLTWLEQPPTASSLKALHLIQSHVHEESLETIFKALPNLETFEYHYACDDERPSIGTRAWLDCSKLGHALQQLKSSLKTLTITIEFVVRSAWELSWTDRFGIRGNLGRLDGFSKLTKLHAPFIVLVGDYPASSVHLVDTLPKGLRHFCCTNDMNDWDGWPWPDPAVLEQFRKYLRSDTCLQLDLLELRVVEVSDWMWHPIWSLIRYELDQLCESAGVRLDFAGFEEDFN